MVKEFLFSVWLIPANPAHDVIAEHIKDLAKTYDAPMFYPHMTLFCGATNDIEQTKKQFQTLFTNQAPLTLKSQSIQHTNFFYKSLFIQFVPSSDLTALNQKVQATLDPNSDYKLNPHASLMYKNLSENKKSLLASTIWATLKEQTQTVTFKKAVLMSDSEEVSEAAVSQWEILDSATFKKESK